MLPRIRKLIVRVQEKALSRKFKIYLHDNTFMCRNNNNYNNITSTTIYSVLTC